MKISIKEVVAMGIGTALFTVLTTVQIPVFVVPNTSIQPRMAVLAFFAAVFGPIVGGVVGFAGHALGDAFFYGGVWWSWVIPELFVGVGIGLFSKKFAVKDGGFGNGKNLIIFNIVQVVTNAVAWILVAPVFDILIYKEPVDKVFAQGAVAFILNIIAVGILGSLLLLAYSRIVGGSSQLKAEE